MCAALESNQPLRLSGAVSVTLPEYEPRNLIVRGTLPVQDNQVPRVSTLAVPKLSCGCARYHSLSCPIPNFPGITRWSRELFRSVRLDSRRMTPVYSFPGEPGQELTSVAEPRLATWTVWESNP